VNAPRHDANLRPVSYTHLDGLAAYRDLIPQAHAVLVPGGFIALEIGCGQHSAISTLLAEAGFTQIDFTSDLQGIQRVVTARR